MHRFWISYYRTLWGFCKTALTNLFFLRLNERGNVDIAQANALFGTRF